MQSIFSYRKWKLNRIGNQMQTPEMYFQRSSVLRYK